MKDVINALSGQLLSYSGLDYAYDSGHTAENVIELIQLNRFPFWNLVPDGVRYEKVDNVPFTQMERKIYPIVIQFATRSMEMNRAVMGHTATGKKGILDFSDDLWEAIKSDRTLGGVVRGVLPEFTINIEILDATGDQDKFFVAAAETTIEFFSEGPV